MKPEEAQWVRDNAWRPVMRCAYPEVVTRCACQLVESPWCSDGHCDGCKWVTPLPRMECYVKGLDGSLCAFPDDYQHPTVSGAANGYTNAAQVWLADRVCKRLCQHACHTKAFQQGALFHLRGVA